MHPLSLRYSRPRCGAGLWGHSELVSLPQVLTSVGASGTRSRLPYSVLGFTGDCNQGSAESKLVALESVASW